MVPDEWFFTSQQNHTVVRKYTPLPSSYGENDKNPKCSKQDARYSKHWLVVVVVVVLVRKKRRVYGRKRKFDKNK